MPDDILDSPPTPPEREKGTTCEFCGCKLARNGEIISVGDRAKQFRKLEEENAKLKDDLASRQTELAEAQRELSSIRQTKSDKGGFKRL
jgi:predicted  nucleic acid-binding Zn-ribbon protein